MVTGRQVRAARDLVGWTATDLAQMANVAVSTIERIESELGTTHGSPMAAVLQALAMVGIKFLPDDGDGPGIRLKPPR